jgi:hypothetical protein
MRRLSSPVIKYLRQHYPVAERQVVGNYDEAPFHRYFLNAGHIA